MQNIDIGRRPADGRGLINTSEPRRSLSRLLRTLLARGTKLLVFVSLWFPLCAHAQLPLVEAILGSVDGPNAVFLADLNRDGTLDAVTASGPDGTGGEIAWWPFDAVTGWTAKQSIDAGFPFAKDVLAADLDRDGDLDVIGVSYEGDEVAWWENSAGDASAWSAKKVIASSANGAVALLVEDIDGDGDPDVLACLRVANSILWIENDGTPSDGGWSSHTVNSVAFSEATGLATGDLDHDGDNDVIGASGLGDQVAWWENDGSPADDVGGDGNSWTFHSIAAGINGARDLEVVDLDHDGDLDVAAAAREGDQVVWVENTSGDGASWSAAQQIGSINSPRDLVVMDLDFDGDVDLLSAGQDDDRVVWWENIVGDASSWGEHPLTTNLNGARGVAVGDVDHDGDLDLAATGFLDDSIVWWENIPIHRSVDFVEHIVSNDTASAAIAVDVDQDGDLDIVGGGFLYWYERQALSWQAHQIDNLAGVTGGLVGSLAVGDIDRDGDPDLAGSNNYRIFWWENDGSPLDDTGGGLGTSWTRHQVSESHSQAQGVSIADIDRDGSPDLLAFDLAGDQVLWWQNDGSPGDDVGGDGNSWTEDVIDGLTNGPRSAIPRDMDRDGDLDVLVVTQVFSPPVSWWRNNGSGTSWSRQTVATGLPLAAEVADTDGDGDLDIVTGEGGGSTDGNLNLSEQLPPADGTQWEASSIIGVLESGQLWVNQLVVADFDLDGDVDAGVVGDLDSTYWYENPSVDSAWLRSEVSIGQFNTNGLRAQQADGRGPIDLIAASSAGDKIVIWENRAAQAKLIASDVSVSPLDDGATSALLRVNAGSLGRNGDSPVEISSLALLLEETPGDPLTGPEASSIIAGFSFYEDTDASGDFDGGLDTLIASSASPSPTDGLFVFVLPNFLATINSGTFRDYFLVVEMAPDAIAQAPNSLRVTMLTGASRMEDATYDSPLVLQSPEDTSTQVLVIELPLFADGFESGGTTLWSSIAP